MIRIEALLFVAWLALAVWGVGTTLTRHSDMPRWMQPVGAE
jgi:hypothetical protein